MILLSQFVFALNLSKLYPKKNEINGAETQVYF